MNLLKIKPYENKCRDLSEYKVELKLRVLLFSVRFAHALPRKYPDKGSRIMLKKGCLMYMI